MFLYNNLVFEKQFGLFQWSIKLTNNVDFLTQNISKDVFFFFSNGIESFKSSITKQSILFVYSNSNNLETPNSNIKISKKVLIALKWGFFLPQKKIGQKTLLHPQQQSSWNGEIFEKARFFEFRFFWIILHSFECRSLKKLTFFLELHITILS